jgi:hypothetical protein
MWEDESRCRYLYRNHRITIIIIVNIAIIVIPHPSYPTPLHPTTSVLGETRILQLNPLFALHPVDMKRKKCFNPNSKEALTGSFEMRENTSCAGGCTGGKENLLPSAIYLLLF